MGGGVKIRRVGRVCGADVTARLSCAVTDLAAYLDRLEKNHKY
jgi:hypothetical protein